MLKTGQKKKRHTSNAGTRTAQRTHSHSITFPFTFAGTTIVVSYSVMNLIEISKTLHVYAHYSKFSTLFFIVKSVTIWASNAALTNTCIHIIPCACRALSLTRTLYHLHEQNSHGQSVCVCMCLRTDVSVCHFAISLWFVRADCSFNDFRFL